MILMCSRRCPCECLSAWEPPAVSAARQRCKNLGTTGFAETALQATQRHIFRSRLFLGRLKSTDLRTCANCKRLIVKYLQKCLVPRFLHRNYISRKPGAWHLSFRDARTPPYFPFLSITSRLLAMSESVRRLIWSATVFVVSRRGPMPRFCMNECICPSMNLPFLSVFASIIGA